MTHQGQLDRVSTGQRHMANAFVTEHALVAARTAGVASPPSSLPPVPWRDPHTAAPADRSAYIQALEQACLANPRSADLRTCLGLAYAVNFDVYKSMDALEAATALDPDHFWAQLKYGELHYRLRALNRAEEETLRALDLAGDAWQWSIARKQLQAIRTLKHTSVRNVSWTKPLTTPALVFSAALALMFAAMMWK
jgi:tetratricopeptide (TPR) repeat protein